MKNIIKVLSMAVICLSLVGCTSTGRIAVVDINGWKPDQMIANTEEAKIVYTAPTGSQKNADPVVGEKVTVPVVSFLAEILEAIKGIRIRILSVEWKK